VHGAEAPGLARKGFIRRQGRSAVSGIARPVEAACLLHVDELPPFVVVPEARKLREGDGNDTRVGVVLLPVGAGQGQGAMLLT
jgi:hypothetical protein